ncbi:AAA family ATPase [Candidatus Uhrbacteria bacterium]|nr:AAA family ATPase [Candidatus Uhrbacteria bacterium]
MQIERERRWLVTSLDPKVYRDAPRKHFQQGYFNTVPGESLRVRIIEEEPIKLEAKMTHKRGKGQSRPETEVSIPMKAAVELYEYCCSDKLEKTRYFVGRCEIDVFHGPLKGLMLVEIEYREDEKIEDVPLPDWLEGAVEVTESISNLMLAKLATILGDSTPPKPLHHYLPSPIPMIVLTGGPGSGKTTAMEALKKEFGNEIKFVPEAATILISQVGIVPPSDDPVGIARFQQTLLRIQRAFEEAAVDQAIRDGKKAVLLDRGTLDSAAYLDGGVKDLERICSIKAHDEAARYARVIWLAPAPESVYEDIRSNNPARREDHAEAYRLGHALFFSWSPYTVVKSAKLDGWAHKYEQVRSYVLGAFGS